MVFVWVELAIAAMIVIGYGYKEMGVGPRPTWTDPMIPESTKKEKDFGGDVIPATSRIR